MSNAWEVTEDDVLLVLDNHNYGVTESRLTEIHNDIDCDEVEDAILAYTDFDDQVNAALSNIEDQLIELGILSGPKKCFNYP